MSDFIVEKLTKSVGDKTVFKEISFIIHDLDRIGIIGVNGTGKTTLLDVVSERIGFDGDVSPFTKANGYKIAYLTQEPEFDDSKTVLDTVLSSDLREMALIREYETLMADYSEENQARLEKVMAEMDSLDAWSIESEVKTVLSKLGLSDLSQKVGDLSGGLRRRVQLAQVLLNDADLLLLDEPTNYLDAEHIDWLKRYLQNYENAFVLISHDIPFLNDVINIVYHVENQQLTRYSGDYYQFLEVYEMKKSQLEAAYERQQKEIADLKDFVARNKARVATRNMAMSRQKKLDKMELIELQSEKPKPSFEFKNARTPGRFIFQAKDLQIGYDRPLTKPLNLTFERNQKVAIIGANGIGKTTLLKSLLGIIPPIAGEVERGDYLELGYFEQEVEGGNRQTPLEAVWNAFPALNQAEVRAALARCGLTTKHIESQIQVLSGGEQAKVRFCLLMNRENNVLVLDEPTNHLDVDAKDELKRALKEYKGSILMVCHEPDFYEGWMDQIWDFNELT